MYFVDRKKIEDILQYMERIHQSFQQIHNLESPVEQLALERMAQGWIEGMIDVGNQMIDGFIMRDPGSYEDILDILEDEEVISAEETKGLKHVLTLRKELVQHYTGIQHDSFQHIMLEEKNAMAAFPDNIRNYLEKELGPVSAFLPEEDK
ncbi:Uncharacterized conserved protein YutE, UPF0331/DUF86 family [Alteribacillus persepolensis]|uniref:Uncharacterized conserved protein YutE, UPF0331/DUF86 family n=1 Tax=Alteribacillus persepolensis TaxID=568899 RepID=A0A1G8DXL1_9BACI|nr:DUF86 domain-containing protein [Alteribacillus persepolensis]SDH62315.1 Uncharacterized conserved protein YutE, UPF0331/DUF86 family [Alteribacillus persepolensis]